MTPRASNAGDDWSADKYNTNASFVYSNAYTDAVLSMLDAQRGERILDLGCGSGELTMRLAELVGPTGHVVGLDSSDNLLAQARALKERVDANPRERNAAACQVDFVLEDAQDLAQPGKSKFASNASAATDELGRSSSPAVPTVPPFDAVFSNAALHWMSRDPQAVADGAYAVLKPHGGRFVAEMGGFLNVVGVRAALHDALKKRGHNPKALDPFYWPTVGQQTRVLERAGFKVEQCELVPRITPLPTGLAGWLETFGFAFFNPLTPEETQEVIQEVCDKLEVDMKSDEGWAIMYTRLRFRAVKK